MLKLTSRIKTTSAKKPITSTPITFTLGNFFIRCYSTQEDISLSRIHPDIAELKLQLDDYDRYQRLIDNVSNLREVQNKKMLNESVNDFQFTGLNLLYVLNKSVGSGSRLKSTEESKSNDYKDIDSLVHEGNFSSDLKEFVTLVQLCLKTSDSGSSLLKLLTKASQYTPSLVLQLSSLEISLLIQKLVKHHANLMNGFMDELQFASRIVKDTKFSIKRREIRDAYENINKIFSKIETSSEANLNIIDYEWILEMHMKQLHHKKAMELIERVEKLALERGDDSLRLTNKMWFHKLAIWTNSSELSFTVGKYNWKVHNIKDWYRFSSNKKETSPQESNEDTGTAEFGIEDADFGFKPTLDTLTVLKSYGESGYSVPVEGQIALLRAIAKENDITMLDTFIRTAWGIEPNSGNTIEGFTFEKSNSNFTYPNHLVLSAIVLSYAHHQQLAKALVVCNSIIVNYGLPIHRTKYYWSALLKASALSLSTVESDIHSLLFAASKASAGYGPKLTGRQVEKQQRQLLYRDPLHDFSDFDPLQMKYDVIDSLWSAATENVVPSKGMLKSLIRYSSLETLLKYLPVWHVRVLNARYNRTVREAAFNENLFLYYLSVCQKKLQSIGEFYKAQVLVEQFSISSEMRRIQLNTLVNFQEKYMRQIEKRRLEEKQQALFDDDDEGFLDF
ncbi:unnamed protein product [Ambrosiozyma monospora]|uniref:Unnamed protein product n=1 Tax=Ambrosiozyma monospora TaxID=43982 RepID=A0ACB5STS5_AMBMO|nr:unnamed protein product [Ambrosiozyma monospora]